MDFIDLFRGSRKVRKIGSGQTLFKLGDAGAEMFVVLEGSAEILLGKTIVEIVRPGGIVGEMALIDDERRSATVVTRTQCEVVALSKADFDRLLHERPEFGRHVLKMTVQRLRRMNQSLVAAQIPAHGISSDVARTSDGRQPDALDEQTAQDSTNAGGESKR